MTATDLKTGQDLLQEDYIKANPEWVKVRWMLRESPMGGKGKGFLFYPIADPAAFAACSGVARSWS